ncbi:MAG: c-type cytochrome [Planctomycetes bacterium]|nr:c-type cytochrome [Planctomycetota bacterium]
MKGFPDWPYSMLLLAAIVFIPFSQARAADTETSSKKPRYRTHIPASEQRPGDPKRGYDYLVEGNYLVSGVPIDMFRAARPAGSNQLKRKGDNASLPYYYTAVTAPNGERVVTANCLRCHAQPLNGKLIIGLGNSTVEFTADRTATVSMVDKMLVGLYGADSPQRLAYKTLHDRFLIVSPQIQTRVRGVNPADTLAYVLARYRDPQTLVWNAGASSKAQKIAVVPTDVPAWWILKKKNAMFYTASGRGDFARIMMASSLLTLKDSEEAAEIDKKFPDVLAYINQLKAPRWPKKIDSALAQKGAQVFKDECARCHGSYGPEGEYPNYLIKLDTIRTDPMLAEQQRGDARYAAEAYNKSWFGKQPHAARLEPGKGYIAPPLDGIWATAPYLHNGSVPDLHTLLNSKLRPRFWQRSFDTSDYNFENIGWAYEKRESSHNGDKNIYDTTLPGYGNQGHSCGDDLSEKKRRAVMEYLKGL